MTDFENLENIEACGECGTFHDSRYCSYVDNVFDDEAPFCEEHPDTTPKMVRGVEGDDIGYECPACALTCVYHSDTLYKDLGRKFLDGTTMKECPKCVDEVKKYGGGLSVSEQSDMYNDYHGGL